MNTLNADSFLVFAYYRSVTFDLMPNIFDTSYIILWVFTLTAPTVANVRFTNLKCNSLDPTFSIVEKCNLKLIRRGTVGLNVTVKLLKTPVTSVSASYAFILISFF